MKKYLKAPILSTAFSESQKSAKNRFKNILSEKGKVGILITVIIAILVVIATAFISIRNSQNENVIPTITSGEKTNADTSEKQLKVILDNISMWSLSGESKEYDTYGYAITDLNGNGRLEIVTSHCDGTGLYSHNKYYEVNENLNGLVEVSTNLKPEEIETYIMDGASKVFYDKVQDEYHYVFTNVTRNGPAEYLESKYELVMKGENINQTLLASKRTIYKGDGGNGETVIKSADGEELTDEQYERYEYLHYADYEYKLAYLEWIASYNLNEADINMVKTELEKSYDGFKLGIPKVEVELNDEYAKSDGNTLIVTPNSTINNIANSASGTLKTGETVKVGSKSYTVAMLGDANGDGKVTAIDYMKIKNNIMGSSTLAKTNKIAADVNMDERITAIDYMRIKNYIMGSSKIDL